MLYAIWVQDVPDSLEKRMAVRPEHYARMQALVDEGRLSFAGPFPKEPGGDPTKVGFAGGLIVADFESREAAERWINDDPYSAAGVIAEVRVEPFIKALPAD